MNIKKILITLIIFMGIFVNISAAHYIVGIVQDSRDGQAFANNHEVILWNPLESINDNLTDIIGPFGNSGVDNFYMIDCELLNKGCNISSILSLSVLNNGDGYISYTKNITITGAGFDIVENLTLNSPPRAYLSYPLNNQNLSTSLINFNCSIEDLDSNLDNVTLYGNWSGTWSANETKFVSGDEKYVIFTKYLEQGFYEYGCIGVDNLSTSNLSDKNITFSIDTTKPNINSIGINESYSCGNNQIRVNCTATDQILGIDKVIIQAISPTLNINYTGIFLSENTYYSDVLINETGNWYFNCFVNDSAGNENNFTSDNFNTFSAGPDLRINYNSIYLNKEDPIENESVILNASVENYGCGDANNVIIGFFIENPILGGININNDSISLPGLSSIEANISWNVRIGKNNIFVLADFGNYIAENNESDNEANKTFSINSWQNIYGNATLNKLIGRGNFSLTSWINESNLTGNVFITDSECNVNWLTLKAIGKKIDGSSSSDDFLEIDNNLGMNNFDDSISNEFSNSQIPKKTENFLIHQNEIIGVPVINSSQNYNFITGILWDYSDDSEDNEYDSSDGEDIVFIGKINKNSEGRYGFYDYEIKIPARLREYKTEESSEVYFYYDLN